MGRVAHNKTMTVDDELLIVKEYLDGKSAGEILKVLNGKFKTKKSVYDILKKHDIKTRNISDYNSTKNHGYFNKIDTENKAYLLGFLSADGWLNIKGNSFNVGLSSTDKKVVELFKQELDTEVKIVETNRTNCKTGYQLIVASSFLYKDLDDLGIRDKLNNQYLPNLNEDLYQHFIRGLFDGDGCVHEAKVNCHVFFLGSIFCISQLSFFLTNRIGVTFKMPKPQLSKGLYECRWADYSDIEKLYHFMYDNASIYLDRKKKIFDNFLMKRAIA